MGTVKLVETLLSQVTDRHRALMRTAVVNQKHDDSTRYAVAISCSCGALLEDMDVPVVNMVTWPQDLLAAHRARWLAITMADQAWMRWGLLAREYPSAGLLSMKIQLVLKTELEPAPW